MRTWTDRSKTFKVEAQFLGCKDGKIHLHKSNGVKIAVPVSKMSVEDIEFVERITGTSLDEDKPLSYVKSQQGQQSHSQRVQQQQPREQPKAGISIEKSSASTGQKENEYDWFDFFLNCGIDLGNCQRYANNFQKESMDETFLPDLTTPVMRNLGMNQGDIIRATKFLDGKYGRGKDTEKKAVSFGGAEVIGDNGGEGSSGGLFSGPGGVLKNNTGRKSRPAPAVLTSDTVDPGAFMQKPSPPPPVQRASKSPPPAASNSDQGFGDDAWTVKPSKQSPQQEQPPPQPPKAATPPAPPAPVSAGLQDLSQLTLDMPPLQPNATHTPPAPAPATVSPPPPQNPTFAAQQRQRPAPPPTAGGPGSFLPPPPQPPQRPISAPQAFQSNNMGMVPPIQVQMTGLPLGSAAPPGQMSMADQHHQMKMAEIQRQQQSLQQTQAAILAQMTGIANPLVAHATGLGLQQAQPQFQPQATGYMNGMPPIQAPQPTLPNQSFQALMNQPTGLAQPMGMGMGMGAGFQQNRPMQPVTMPVNQLLPPAMIPQQTGLQPLQPQATGPPPPVRFGVTPKLAPQPTGKKANLSQASELSCFLTYAGIRLTIHLAPSNPFGF